MPPLFAKLATHQEVSIMSKNPLHPRFLIGWGLAWLLSLACSLPFLGRHPTAPAPTNDLRLLFQDDFTDASGGWATFTDPDGSVTVTDQALRIQVNVPSTIIWSTPDLDLQDVRIEVDAFKADGPDDNLFGVVCRYLDPNHFYLLAISSDGFYGIAKFTPEGETLLTGESMEYSDAILQGEATNHITALCQGNRLSLRVNDILLVEAVDNAYSHGDIGLLAGTFDLPGTTILFDNLLVLQP